LFAKANVDSEMKINIFGMVWYSVVWARIHSVATFGGANPRQLGNPRQLEIIITFVY